MKHDTIAPADPVADEQILPDCLALVRAAYRDDPHPDLAARLDRLDRLRTALVDHRQALIRAVQSDFTTRPGAETDLLEIIPVLESIAHTRTHLRKWMRSSRRSVPLGLWGARAAVHYQPKGVVGIMVPWNFPLFLSLSPLAGALAAGNRVMIKMSELAPATAKAVEQMIAAEFDKAEVAVITGGPDVAAEFSALPFDHLLFTGSTSVGRKVMQAAAQNLTPVTLELGGKSPAIVHPDFPLKTAASRIAFGKGLNAGQICVAPDYVLVQRTKVDDFIAAYTKAVQKLYPTQADNPDYTSIISPDHKSRIEGLIEDAQAKGAIITSLAPPAEDFDGTQKLPMSVAIQVDPTMDLMNDEIFGPVLPIVAYDDLEDALAYVNDRDRPLALYYFDWDKDRTQHVIQSTHSGGAAINDVVTQVAADDMPFGGIGASGMGHYHGHEGFLTFSKAKSVLHKGRFNTTWFIQAPWGKALFRMYVWLMLKWRG